MDVETITSTSADISWDPPANENPGNVRYTFEVTSSCPSGNIRQENFVETTFQLTNLCSGKLYSFVVQATDITNNVTGSLSQPLTFRTAEGIPTVPRDVRLILGEKILTVQWTEPTNVNGILTHYEAFWISTNINNCDEAYKLCNLEDAVPCNLANTTSIEYNSTFSVDTAVLEFVLVCVRAYTSAGRSKWGSYYNGTVKSVALITNGEEDECSGLIVVAVIASFAVVCSVTMGIILAVVIYKTRDSLSEYSNKNGKFEEKPLPLDYNRSASMQSTKSLISRNDN